MRAGRLGESEGLPGEAQTGDWAGGAEGSRGRASPPRPFWTLRARHGGRASGVGRRAPGTATGREWKRERGLQLSGRRGRRGAGPWRGGGVGRLGLESPPRWHPTLPKPHLAGFFPGRGAAAAPPSPIGCHRLAPAAPPHLRHRPAAPPSAPGPE